MSQGNLLRTLEPLAALTGLEVVLAARNRLESVRGLEGLAGLRRLDVSGNAIASLDGISHVRGSAVLSELLTAGNPMDKVRKVYRSHLSGDHVLAGRDDCSDLQPCPVVLPVEATSEATAVSLLYWPDESHTPCLISSV